MNFAGITWAPPLGTTFTFIDGRDPVYAVHPLMRYGEPIECNGEHWIVRKATVVSDESGESQTVELMKTSGDQS